MGCDSSAKVNLENGPENPESKMVPLHQKNPDLGNKAQVYSKTLLIESADAESLKDGEKFTLRNWGNAIVTKIVKKGNKTEINAKLILADENYKDTKKINWIPEDS